MKEPRLAEKLESINRYYMKVMPDIKKYLNNAALSLPEGLRDPRAKKGKPLMVCNMDDLKCSGVLASLNRKDITGYTEFIVSLHALCHSLGRILESRELTDISEIQQLYIPFSDSISPDISTTANCEYFRNREITEYLKKLSDKCREKIAALPNYKMVTGKMKKYARLYIELQSCKYQPLKTRNEHMRMWSEYYIRQYPGLSFWEFSASADSILGICAMYITACSPGLTEEYVNYLDAAYLPWVCAYQKMLYYYVNAREDIITGRLNLTDFYRNLKYCEERLKFLAGRALEGCSLLPGSNIHMALVQVLPAIYLSDPRACFGLNRLASLNIMNDSSSFARILWNCSRLPNSFR